MLQTKTILIPPGEAPDLPSYVPVREKRAYWVGYDPGKLQDPAAVVTLEHLHTGTTTWSVHERPSKPAIKRQQATDFYNVRDIVIFENGMAYPDQAVRVAAHMAHPALAEARAKLVVDSGGVGEAAADVLERAGLKVNRLTITGGREAKQDWKEKWTVAKMALVTNMDAAIQNGSFKVADGLEHAPVLFDQLREFRRHTLASGIMGFEAPDGKHDDVLMACTIALWMATRPPPPVAQFGSWGHV